MFGLLGSLVKATVGVVVETPIAIAADVVTMGGALTDKNEPYTATALKKVAENVSDASDPESYFASLMLNQGGDNWTTIIQLPPMPVASPTKGAAATMADILAQFNAKLATVPPGTIGQPATDATPWIERLKKLFDGVTVVDGKIVIGS